MTPEQHTARLMERHPELRRAEVLAWERSLSVDPSVGVYYVDWLEEQGCYIRANEVEASANEPKRVECLQGHEDAPAAIPEALAGGGDS